METVIEIKNIVVQYGPKKILDGLSLNVQKGRIFGFIGPNGAGKSTTIKSILGLVFPVSGSIKLHGLDPADPCSRQKIGFVPEEANHYRFLNAEEALRFYGELSGLSKSQLDQKVPSLLEKIGLKDAARRLIGTFSKGMSQKVSLAQALLHDPDTLILDEPTTGLDPLAKLQLRSLLLELKSRGKTVFFSSHELGEVELICDDIAMLKNGRVIRSGDRAGVLQGSETSLEKMFLQIMGEKA